MVKQNTIHFLQRKGAIKKWSQRPGRPNKSTITLFRVRIYVATIHPSKVQPQEAQTKQTTLATLFRVNMQAHPKVRGHKRPKNVQLTATVLQICFTKSNFYLLLDNKTIDIARTHNKKCKCFMCQSACDIIINMASFSDKQDPIHLGQ